MVSLKIKKKDMSISAKITRTLVDVAMGREKADLVIRNGRWVCVQSGEIIPGTDVAVAAGRIAYVGRMPPMRYPARHG